ncbi:MAG: class I SAM-dependent methyltransferase, partial [Methanomassiliicoccales archaeon]|nr:class I SAM-dependent methyltransferase [Methanomassiliicoccales archaeon]
EGQFTHLASNKGWKVVGIDVDNFSVSAARRQTPGADFAVGSGGSLPFPSETFDRVIMLDVLEHVPSEELALSEVERVLKHGGKLVLSVPHKGAFGFIDAQNSLIFATGRKIIKGRENGQHHKHYSLEELQGMLGSSFSLTRCRYGGYLLFPVLGYALMFTDALHLWRLSASLRRVEQIDFDRDRGKRSWHLMTEFTKQ